MPSGGQGGPVNAMTVDVEDYFQVQAFAGCIDRRSWGSIPCRVETNMDVILEQFSRAGVKGTFFTLGWIADRFPGVVRRIVEGGHELGSHGYGHQLVHELSPEQFRADLRHAKSVLEQAGGVSVSGYRAPTFSIGPRNPWAFEVLEETGHRYSSSVYPVRHDLYGAPDAPRFPHRPGGGAIVEIPMTTLRLGRRNLPIAGGGYFRLVPYAVYRSALRRFNAREQKSGIFYFHPWEIDAGQPRVTAARRLSRFRHYVNIAAVPHRLERLLHDFRWGRMDEVFAADLVSQPR